MREGSDVLLSLSWSGLPDLGKQTKSKLEQGMRSHILGQAELVGVYQKSR